MRRLTAMSLFVLAGCVTTVEPPEVTREASRDIRTTSDQTDPERRARVRLELASAYFARGQTATALDEVKQALSAKPDLFEGFNLRGLIYATMAEPRLAEESFQRALQLNPRDGDSMHNLAWFWCQQGRFDDGDRMFTQTLAQPQYLTAVRTLFAQGVCQARAGRWAEAERTLSRSYELDPANPVTAYNLSEVLLQRGEFDRARFYVARINGSQELSNAQSLWLATRIEHRMGNAAGVQQWGRQLRDRFPQSPEALQYSQGRFDGQ
jgi:type IV pilus assembly protein PilF